MTEINLKIDDNYTKCAAIRKLGYDVEKAGNGCMLTSKKYKNIDHYIDVYYPNVNTILLTFKQDLSMAGYKVVA